MCSGGVSQICPSNVPGGVSVPNCTAQGFPLLPPCPADAVFKKTQVVGTCAPCSSIASPGYVCKDSVSRLCSAGFYCPFDPDTKSYDKEVPCPAGSVCMLGFVEPVQCRAMVTCDAGAEKIMVGTMFILLLVLTGFMACSIGACLQYRKTRQIKQSAALRDNFEQEDGVVLGQGFQMYTSPVTVEFSDVGMRLKAKGKKQILSGVTGYFPPGSLVALMGPSGGGKTTFMNALLGRAPYATVSGSVKINGVEGGLKYAANMVGFVPQDDIVHGDLTVYQNILYNALLRLPDTVDKQTKLDHVQQVINILGLSHIQNDAVGSPEKRGVSGGQKKRVNIGMELAAMPSIVFMDEPTSGLDGAATLELAVCLAELKKSGLTIVCVIHQPRYTVFNKFSHLLLLGAGGQQVYGGRTELVQTYLQELGFRLPNKENPADWMLDVVCGLSPRYLGDASESKADDAVDHEFKAPADLFRLWSKNHEATASQPDSRWNAPAAEQQDMRPLQKRDVPNRCIQTRLLLQRVFRQHTNSSFAFMLGMLFAAGLLFGNLSAKSDFSYSRLYSSLGQSGSIAGMIVGIQSHTLVFSERLQFNREFKSGVSVVGYLLAKVLYDFLRTFFYVMAFVIPKYSLNMPLQSFGSFQWAWLGYGWYWSGVGLFLAVALSSGTAGLLILVLVPNIEMFFSGTNGNIGYINDMSSGQQAISCLTSGRWVYQDLYVNELAALPGHALDFAPVKQTLANSTISTNLSEAHTQAQVALWMLGLGWRLLALMTLMLMKYSEGGGCLSQIYYVVSQQMSDLFNMSTPASREAIGEDDMTVKAQAVTTGPKYPSHTRLALSG